MADDEHNKNPKKPSGALNVERRTWDLEHFEKVAKERLEKEASGIAEKQKPGFVRKREEFQSAEQGAAGPEGSKRAYLKHREADLGLEDKVGKIQVVTGSSAPHQQGGYWCDICQCLLKDSMAYLDHINGKKHQKTLGFSMRVERVGVDRVKERLGALKRREEERKNAGPRESAIKVYERKLEEEEAVKEQWKEARKEARRKIIQRTVEEEEEEDGEGGGEEEDEMAAMMGFGGFGGK